MVQALWTPPGTVQEATVILGRVNPDLDIKDMAFQYKFTFTYKGRVKRITVATTDTTSRAEIEDKAAECAERWIAEMEDDPKYEKRVPTAEEKRDIGKALNEKHLWNERVRDSSTGKTVFKVAK